MRNSRRKSWRFHGPPLVRGTAYGQQGMLKQSRPSIVFAQAAPNDAQLHFALANTLFDLREYQDSIQECSFR